MMVITISDKGWIATQPKLMRPVLMNRVFSIATVRSIPVRVAGQHWATRP